MKVGIALVAGELPDRDGTAARVVEGVVRARSRRSDGMGHGTGAVGAWVAAVALACVVATGAWREGRGVAPPTFVAIGGGLADDHRAVYGELLARKDTNKIVVVPFASADAKEASRRAAERFRRYRPDARIVTLPDPLESAEFAGLAAEWIRHADLVFFTGGDQGRITPRFLGERGPNGVLQALEEGQLRFATLVGGTSAGCAVLSDPMFTGGGSESALADLPATDGEGDVEEGAPALRGVRLGRGLGLVRGVIMDSHFMERGRYGRMVAALEASNMRYGVGVNENRAVRISSGRFTGIGDGAALVVDVKDLEREGLSRRGVRVSLLSDGDVFIERPGEREARFGTRAAAIERLVGPAPDASGGGAWEKGVLAALLVRLASDPSSAPRASSERFVVEVRADGRTRFAAEGGDAGTLRVFEARLDIIVRGEGR